MRTVEEEIARLKSRIDFGKGAILNLGAQRGEGMEEELEPELIVLSEIAVRLFDKLRPFISEMEFQCFCQTKKGELLVTGVIPVAEIFIPIPIVEEWLEKMRSDGHLNDSSLLLIHFFEKQKRKQKRGKKSTI